MYEVVFYTPKEIFSYYIVIMLSAIIVYPILRVLMGSVKIWK